MPTRIRSGETILFIGDSITDCGRREAERPLGRGYVKSFADMLAIREPAKEITVINKGISGDRVTGLRDRWSDDVLRHRPDWLSIKIGINDLHSFLLNNEPVVPVDLFREAYNDVLSRTKAALPRCRVLLVDPFYISTDSASGSFRREVLSLLPAYLKVVHTAAARYKTRLVRTHEMFQRLLRHHEPDTFAPEPVHPNLTGHLAIAEAVYAALSR